MRRLIVALLMLAPGAPALAAGKSIRAALVGYQVALAGDIWTTERGLNAGMVETNPLSPARPTDSDLAWRYTVMAVGVWAVADYYGPRHPKAARTILWTMGAIHLICAISNHRLTNAQPE